MWDRTAPKDSLTCSNTDDFWFDMRMKRMPAVLVILLSSFGLSLAQTNAARSDDTVAVIGAVPVLATELRQRLELMPWPGKERTSRNDSIRIRALHGLVAERLLSYEAVRLDLVEDEVSRRMKRGLENLLLRDELYRREVTEKSRPNNQQILNGIERFARQLEVLTVAVPDERAADAVIAAWKRVHTLDSIMQVMPRGIIVSLDTITVNFGELEPPFEDAAYSLRRGGSALKLNSRALGWVVLNLVGSGTNPASTRMTLTDRRHRVESVLQSRNEALRAEEFYFGFLSGRSVEADSILFSRLVQEILAVWEEDTAVAMQNNAYVVGSGMIDELTTRMADVADRPYVRLEDGPLTIADVLEMLRYQALRSPVRAFGPLADRLNMALKDIVAGEMLAREARRRKLQYAPRVERDMQMWTSYWAGRSLFHKIRDSVAVTDADVDEFLRAHAVAFGAMYEVNVQEVLVADVTTADSVFTELKRGISFADVARVHTLREEWRLRGGESGFFAVSDRPELGFHALQGEVGAIQGPIRLKEGLSIFRLLEVRSKEKRVPSFDTLKANVRSRLLAEKRQQRLNEYLVEQAKRYQVRFFYDKLQPIPITDFNMFTRRNIGFGGTMIAVPMLLQQWEWVNAYEKDVRMFP